MPERKRFFSVDPFPNTWCWALTDVPLPFADANLKFFDVVSMLMLTLKKCWQQFGRYFKADVRKRFWTLTLVKIYPHIREPMRHLCRIENIDWCGWNWPFTIISTLNFGPFSTKLDGTIRAIKKWPRMTTDTVRDGITMKRPFYFQPESVFWPKILSQKTPKIS